MTTEFSKEPQPRLDGILRPPWRMTLTRFQRLPPQTEDVHAESSATPEGLNQATDTFSDLLGRPHHRSGDPGFYLSRSLQRRSMKQRNGRPI
jgi:hypothetical protein